MHVSIVVVNYNKKDLLEKCLASLQKIVYTNFTVIVVDNGSKDGSLEMVKKNFPQFRVIEMGYNAGFCKGNNVGIATALENGSDAVFLLNNDTEVEPHILSSLTSCVRKEERVCMVAPKVCLMDDRSLLDSTGIVITPDGLAKNRDLLKSADTAVKKEEVFCPTGAAALYTKEVLNDIVQDGQYFDEDYEYYFEDLDMGWRARLQGFQCVYDPGAIVYHHKNATAGAYSELIAFYTNRNIFYNIIKNYPFPYCVKAIFLTFLRYPLLLFGAFMGKGPGSKFQKNISKKVLAVVILKGWCDVLKNVVRLLSRRRYIQKRRAASRKECGNWFSDFGLSFFDSLYK